MKVILLKMAAALKGLIALIPKTLLIICAVVIVLFLVGKGLGFGNGFGDGEGDGNSTSESQTESTEQEEVEDVEEVEEESVAEKTTENGDEAVLILEVTIMGNDYFYENERIALDALMTEIESTEGQYIVKILDDNASLNAYENLVDELDAIYAEYIEGE